MFKVILYYKFYPIKDIVSFWQEHKAKCRQLCLSGRVLMAEEGINGTLAGAIEAIDQYKTFLRSQPGFETTEFKEDLYSEIPFDRLIVKIRPEIVSLKPEFDLKPGYPGAAYLEPEVWRKELETGRDHVLLDVRNNYETKVGRFKGAVTPNVENFYDFPAWLENAKIDKNKKILMYCTGGIRCEKFSVYMKQKGYHNIYQLRGGIIRYAQEQSGAHFEGKCFVFDDRMVVGVNPESAAPISRCEISGVPCDTFINCANMECNKLFICSEVAAVQMEGCCSEECKRSIRRRPLNIENIYKPFRRWYNYFAQKPGTKEKRSDVCAL